jgi:hypothetical protein
VSGPYPLRWLGEREWKAVRLHLVRWLRANARDRKQRASRVKGLAMGSLSYWYRLGCCHWGSGPSPNPSPFQGEGNRSRRPLALPSNQSLSQRPLGEGGRAEQGREGAVPCPPPPPLTPPPCGERGTRTGTRVWHAGFWLPSPRRGRGEVRAWANNLTTSGIMYAFWLGLADALHQRFIFLTARQAEAQSRAEPLLVLASRPGVSGGLEGCGRPRAPGAGAPAPR